jgi:glycine cleavage system aminomethyltransferase T
MKELTQLQYKKSPLHSWHMANGAEMMWDDGYPWAYHEGKDPLEEYEAIRTKAGLLDLFPLFMTEVSGAGAEKAIQQVFSNSLKGVKNGQIRYGAFVNPRGLMLDEGNVFKFADDHYWVIANGPGIDTLMEEFASGLEVNFKALTDELATIGVQGPQSRDILQKLIPSELNELPYYRFWTEKTEIAGYKGWIARMGYSGEIGYEVTVPVGVALPVWEALINEGGQPFGITAVDLARIEVGLLLIYEDYIPGRHSPWDLSMDRFIKVDTDCLAAKALADYGKNPPLRFKTLKLQGADVPSRCDGVFLNDEIIGSVTSAALSPRLGSIALALLKSEHAENSTRVRVATKGEMIPAEVSVLSLLDPEKKRPK